MDPTPVPQPVEPAAAPPVLKPDVSLGRALRRLAARSTISAGAVAGLAAAALVTAASAVVAVLFWTAHIQNGCSAEVPSSLASGGCTDSGINGYLTNWNAALWQSVGSGQVFGFANGTEVTVRIPLGLGMVLVALALFAAGRWTVRMLPVPSPRDATLRALAIAVTFTALMVIVGAAITARGPGLAIGPEYGLLLLWCMGLAFPMSFAGIVRRLFGDAVPRVPLATIRARLGRAYAPIAAAVMGVAVALVLSAVLGILAMATHSEDTANIVRNQQVLTAGKVFPDSVVGTVAAVAVLVLAIPTVACWVLAYGLIVTTVSVGGLGQATEFGLTTGSHDAYLWVAVIAPLAAALVSGYGAARLWRAGTVEQAVTVGAAGGLVWAVLTWIVIALLDGIASVSGSIGVGGATGGALTFGPGLQNTLLALLVAGVVVAAAGGYVSLALVTRTVRLPVLRRYNVAVVGPPVVPVARVCPNCGLQLRLDAAFCSRCGSAQMVVQTEMTRMVAVTETEVEPPPPT